MERHPRGEQTPLSKVKDLALLFGSWENRDGIRMGSFPFGSLDRGALVHRVPTTGHGGHREVRTQLDTPLNLAPWSRAAVHCGVPTGVAPAPGCPPVLLSLMLAPQRGPPRAQILGGKSWPWHCQWQQTPQPTVTLKPQWKRWRQWLRKAPSARVTGSGGSFFSRTAPTHQLLSTTPVGRKVAWGRQGGRTQ